MIKGYVVARCVFPLKSMKSNILIEILPKAYYIRSSACKKIGPGRKLGLDENWAWTKIGPGRKLGLDGLDECYLVHALEFTSKI